MKLIGLEKTANGVTVECQRDGQTHGSFRVSFNQWGLTIVKQSALRYRHAITDAEIQQARVAAMEYWRHV